MELALPVLDAPADAEGLCRLGARVRGVIAAAQGRGDLPGGYGRTGKRVVFRVYASREVASGVVTVNVRVSGFEYLAGPPGDWPAVLAWLLADGLAVVRLADRLIGRERYVPTLAGRTVLEPVLPG